MITKLIWSISLISNEMNLRLPCHHMNGYTISSEQWTLHRPGFLQSH